MIRQYLVFETTNSSPSIFKNKRDGESNKMDSSRFGKPPLNLSIYSLLYRFVYKLYIDGESVAYSDGNRQNMLSANLATVLASM